MKTRLLGITILMVSLVVFAAGGALAAPAGTEVIKAKKEAESRGYLFFVSHDEIVAGAKKEGKLRVMAELEPATIAAMTRTFKKQYPFIDIQIDEITGTDAAQRFILELKAGLSKDWDIINMSRDFLNDYIPYLAKVDLLGMAEHRVLAMPPPMIYEKMRNMAAYLSRFQVTAYNSKLLPASQVPRSWEDILKPAFKGRKFAADIRPTEIAALVPAWGLERTLDYSRKIAAQDPVWVRGGSRTLTSIIAGEIPMMIGPNYHTVRRAQGNDPAGVLKYVSLEPVPLKLSLELAISASAKNLNAAILWMEWLAGNEAQRIADELEPFASSVYVRGGVVEKELSGKQLSVVSWEDNFKMQEWQQKVVEAYGFPKAKSKNK